MKFSQSIISPQDIVVLLRILSSEGQTWTQSQLAESLRLSQSEISKSLKRSQFSGLLDSTGKKVRRLALMDFLAYGIKYTFPQRPGPVLKGVPTAHAAPPLNKEIASEEPYVWPSVKGKVRGQSIIPLYPNLVEAALLDDTLYELLALVDAIRVGRSRERELAISMLKKRILHGA